MKYYKGLDRSYGQTIEILSEVDDEDENGTLIACPPDAQVRVQIWTNVYAQTLSLIAPTKILRINIFLNQS